MRLTSRSRYATRVNPEPHLLTAGALALCGLVDGSLDHRERDIVPDPLQHDREVRPGDAAGWAPAGL